MSLSRFFLELKGGYGSGNKDHSGRPGKRGGSNPKGSQLPANPTSLEFSNYKLFEKENLNLSRPVYFRLDQLPPIPPGHTRIYHGTAVDNLKSIDQKGLLPGSEIDKKERLSTILGTTQEPSSFGEVSVIIDLPPDKFHHVNADWVEFNKIEPSNISAYYVSKIQGNIKDIIPIYEEYDKLYGS